MTKTKGDIINRAARSFNYIGATETLEGDSYDMAEGEYDTLHEWGRAQFPKTWSWNINAVDDRYWTYVSGMLAGKLVHVLPTSDTGAQKARALAEQSLRFFNQQSSRSPRATVQVSQV